MEVAVELEDDVFFADLNKQISLLIMDDDDEDPVVHRPPVSLQAISKAIQPATQPSFSYQQTCMRESKGTGVFIPKSSSRPRRKKKQGKFSSSSSSSSSNGKLYRHSDHSSRGLLPYAANNYSTDIPSHNISFNPKRS